MGWTPSKPTVAGNPAADVVNLQGNWDYIETFSNKEHRFSGAFDDGYHNQINLPVQAVAPVLNLDGVAYVNDNGASKELLYKNAIHTSSLSGVVARFSWDVSRGALGTNLRVYNAFNIKITDVDTHVTEIAGNNYTTFTVAFTTAMPDKNYTVISNALSGSYPQAICANVKTVNGFGLLIPKTEYAPAPNGNRIQRFLTLGFLECVVYKN